MAFNQYFFYLNIILTYFFLSIYLDSGIAKSFNSRQSSIKKKKDFGIASSKKCIFCTEYIHIWPLKNVWFLIVQTKCNNLPQTRVFITISLRLQKRPDEIFFTKSIFKNMGTFSSGGHGLFLILMFIQVLISLACREGFFNAIIFFGDTGTHTVDAKEDSSYGAVFF